MSTQLEMECPECKETLIVDYSDFPKFTVNECKCPNDSQHQNHIFLQIINSKQEDERS